MLSNLRDLSFCAQHHMVVVATKAERKARVKEDVGLYDGRCKLLNALGQSQSLRLEQIMAS